VAVEPALHVGVPGSTVGAAGEPVAPAMVKSVLPDVQPVVVFLAESVCAPALSPA